MKFSPRAVVALLISIAGFSSTAAQSADDNKPLADRPLTKYESSLIGRWYTFGGRDMVSYIASSGSVLFTINDVKHTLELSCAKDGSLFGHSSSYQVHGVVSGNFILWSNGTWWSRYPVDFNPKKKALKSSSVVLSDQSVDDSLTVLSASYGTDNKFSDVTNTVVNLLRDDREHHANPDELKADPNPGWNKALVITYLLNGTRFITPVVENAPFSRRILERRISE